MANNERVTIDNLEELVDEGEITNVCDLYDEEDEDFVTLTLHPFLDDHGFFFNQTGGATLHMTEESIENLLPYFTRHGFNNFEVYQPVLTMHTDGTLPYFNSDYATWISMYEADVYACYQDVVEDPTQGKVIKIYMIKAKHNQGYYKIPAATIYKPESIIDDEPIPVGYVEDMMWNWRPTNGVYRFPGYNDTFMDWYYESAAGTAYNSDETNYAYTPSAAVIIIENNKKGAKDGKGYERHSASNLINESTLDPGNQMMITRKPIGELSESSKLFQFTHPNSGGDNEWVRMKKGTIKAGRLVLPITAGASNGNDSLPSRVEVIWINDDVTGIMNVKDYIKSLNDSEAIYNLQGVKVTAPVKGQLYIQGGKKFIQK